MMEYYPEAAGPAYADPFVNSCILPAKFLHGVAGADPVPAQGPEVVEVHFVR